MKPPSWMKIEQLYRPIKLPGPSKKGLQVTRTFEERALGFKFLQCFIKFSTIPIHNTVNIQRERIKTTLNLNHLIRECKEFLSFSVKKKKKKNPEIICNLSFPNLLLMGFWDLLWFILWQVQPKRSCSLCCKPFTCQLWSNTKSVSWSKSKVTSGNCATVKIFRPVWMMLSCFWWELLWKYYNYLSHFWLRFHSLPISIEYLRSSHL